MNIPMDFQKNSNKRYLQIIISAVLILVVFFAGFYYGSSRSKNSLQVVGDESSTEKVDLTTFWKVWDILNQKFAPASSTKPMVSNQDKVYGAASGLAASFGDPYTTFFPPVESKMFSDEIAGSFEGVGMEIDIASGTLTVIAPVKGSPAERAGVKAGDKILKIDNTPAAMISTDEAVKLIRGDKGTSVKVTFTRNGGAPFEKTLVREPIDIPTIDTKKLDNGIFMISLYSFTATSPNLFRNALREFVESGDDKLILDLRNNPGGYLEAALDMASWFLPAGKVVVTEDYGGKQPADVYKSKGYDIFNDNLKFVILVNGGSASASEILSGALSEYHKATLIGENTFGKGSVQELVPITDNTTLKVTVAHWYTPNGKSISNGGLTPDIIVKEDPEDAKNQVDTALNRAKQFLTTGK